MTPQPLGLDKGKGLSRLVFTETEAFFLSRNAYDSGWTGIDSSSGVFVNVR